MPSLMTTCTTTAEDLAACPTGAEAARLYGFLAGVFSSTPTAESISAVVEMAAALDIVCPQGLTPGELEREFMDLFVVPNSRYAAPYESAYRDRWLLEPGSGSGSENGSEPLVMERLLMGESTLAVRQCFIEAGVEPLEDLPDHLSNELRLMSYLRAPEAQGSLGDKSSSGRLRAEVRDGHLRKWIGQLRHKVRDHDRLGFYSAALEITEVILHNDETTG